MILKFIILENFEISVKKKPFEMLTGEVSTMPTREETTDTRNFCRFVSVR